MFFPPSINPIQTPQLPLSLRVDAHERTELAAERALHFGARSYRPVERLLRLGRERMALPDAHSDNDDRVSVSHENVRGPDYYH